MTASTTAPAPTSKIPRTYFVWLAGSLVSRLGDSVLFFALGWVAAGLGGAAAGLVLTCVAAPRTVLLLVGGVVADRFSVKRVLIVGDAVMLVLLAVSAGVSMIVGTPLWLLLAVGLAVGSIDAFYLPATGTLPRRLVEGSGLPRAMALNQTGSQVIALAGGPLGAVLVIWVGFSGTVALDAASFAAALLAIVMIRKSLSAEPLKMAGGVLRAAGDGVRVAVRHPILRPGLVMTAAVAGLALPVASLLVPLLAREQNWGAHGAGLVFGAQAVGAVVVSLTVFRRGAFARTGVVAGLAMLPLALGTAVMASAPAAALATVGAALFGVGLGLFISHLGPLMLTASPDTHLSRVQAIITLVQSGALLVTLNVLGGLADATSARTATSVAAAGLLGAGLVVSGSRALRDAGRGV